MASTEDSGIGDQSTIDVDGWDELLPAEPSASQASLPKVPTVPAAPTVPTVPTVSRPATVAPAPQIEPLPRRAPQGRSTIIADAAKIADVVRTATQARRSEETDAPRPGSMAGRTSTAADGNSGTPAVDPPPPTASGRFRVASGFAPAPPTLNLSAESGALGSGAKRRTGLDFVRAAASESNAALSLDAGESDRQSSGEDAGTPLADSPSAVDDIDDDDTRVAEAPVGPAGDAADCVSQSSTGSHDAAEAKPASRTNASVRAHVGTNLPAAASGGLGGGVKLGIAAAAAALVVIVVATSGGSSADDAERQAAETVAAASVVSKSEAKPDVELPAKPAKQPAARLDVVADAVDDGGRKAPDQNPAAIGAGTAATPVDQAPAQPAAAETNAPTTAVPGTADADPGAAGTPGVAPSGEDSAAPAGDHPAGVDGIAPTDGTPSAVDPAPAAIGDAGATEIEQDGGAESAADDGGYDSDSRVYSKEELLGLPSGTNEKAARVFQSRTLFPGDRPPLAAVGTGGVHIDRIMVGTKRRGRGCNGKSEFVIDVDSEVVVCFRVVLARKGERLQLRWRKGDETMRRAFLPLKGTRVRNGRIRMPVRPKFAGDWELEVATRRGEVLATVPFSIRGS